MATWRKSSYSGSSSGQMDCVELARLPAAIGVRDSKAPEVGHLSLTVESFTALVARVKQDELDL